jgi:hypothetical protein
MKNQDEFRLWFYTKDVRNPDLGINLSKYDVDEIVHVFVEEKGYRTIIRYDFNKKTKVLYMLNSFIFKRSENEKLYIKFYSKSHMRDKLIGEIFDENEF